MQTTLILAYVGTVAILTLTPGPSVIDGSTVFLDAATAGRLSSWLSQKGRLTTRRRIAGWALIGAAGLLAFKGARASSS
jgi:threonine/homoserine/homoserine lactone efflux protein